MVATVRSSLFKTSIPRLKVCKHRQCVAQHNSARSLTVQTRTKAKHIYHLLMAALTAGALPSLPLYPHKSFQAKRRCGSSITASSSSVVSTPEEGQLERPQWAGETPLSRLVGALISFKPFYSLMKLGARQVLIRLICLFSRAHLQFCSANCMFFFYFYFFFQFQIVSSTAEKSNIPWREMTKEILESNVYEEFERIRDPSLVYPVCKFFLAKFIRMFFCNII